MAVTKSLSRFHLWDLSILGLGCLYGWAIDRTGEGWLTLFPSTIPQLCNHLPVQSVFPILLQSIGWMAICFARTIVCVG